MDLDLLLNSDEHMSSSTTSNKHPCHHDRQYIERAIPVHPSSQSSTTISAAKSPKIERTPPNLKCEFKGEVNYPPYIVEDDASQAMMNRFRIRSVSEIAQDPRVIPYSSDKRTFSDQTGRSGFEVFTYSFRFPRQSHEWDVLWDYNIGLVRITPFFKALGYAKTVPAKAIGQTPGLGDLCHSITGGSVKAQGYWIPFEAAKALAETFCWEIRFALLPLFGPEFVNDCLHPDNTRFRQFRVRKSIIVQCREAAQSWSKVRGSETRKRVRAQPVKALEVANSRRYKSEDSEDRYDSTTPEAMELGPTDASSTASNTSSSNQRSTASSSTSMDVDHSTSRRSAFSRGAATYQLSQQVDPVVRSQLSSSHVQSPRKKCRNTSLPYSVDEARAARALLQLSNSVSQC